MLTVEEILAQMTVRESDYECAKLLTRKELRKLINSQEYGFRILVAVRLDAPMINDEQRFIRDGITGSIEVSRKVAHEFVASALSDSLEERGARFRCYVTERKSYYWNNHEHKTRNVRTLWISQ